MQIAMVGLGRMGANMARRLMRDGRACVVYDRNPAALEALARNPGMSNYSGFVQDSGEGRWTVQAAIDEAVPAEVLTAALYARFRSRQDHTFAEKMLSAMRQGFGGHVEPVK
jgi:6-phosphogluconate dehydrogenase (decarboxylating)